MSNLLMNTTATDMSLDSAVAPVTVTVEDTRELLSSSHVYLDVWTAEEFGKGHVDNVVCVPYMFFTLEDVWRKRINADSCARKQDDAPANFSKSGDVDDV
ncbi:hypothetical protein J5N97_024850 [Dioscorea zingiberensis]|uniref:Rhodanese domain-containing protein n=1 Tax=Dioscorea zingiberensis TaxID=325984 RepID=A0A9D5C811_9LILI|nr:hypothetical protein J5N97_024850 [Dioscorea zingiberensis]